MERLTLFVGNIAAFIGSTSGWIVVKAYRIAIIASLLAAAYIWWADRRDISCIEETVDTLIAYTNAMGDFNDAEDEFLVAANKILGDETGTMVEAAAQVHENMMAVWADSRQIIEETKAPNCLADMTEENLERWGAPSEITTSDLSNWLANVQRAQKTLLTFMDSAYECHQDYKVLACAKRAADQSVTNAISDELWVFIEIVLQNE